MKRFLALYFLFLVGLFVVFYLPTSSLSFVINQAQTNLTLFLLEPFLEKNQLVGIEIWINPKYKIIISQACNGLIPILFLTASILAYSSSYKHKIIWIIFGYMVFSVMNVLRILLVAYAVKGESGQGNFYWSHDIVGNSVLMFIGVVLFVLFIKTSTQIKS